MPTNATGTISIFRDVSNVPTVSLSSQESGVRVRAVQAPSTRVKLPTSPFPNNGDSYEIVDADGSSSALNQIVIVPPAGTTIRGAASFAVQTAFESVRVIFDADADDWLVEQGPQGPQGATGPQGPQGAAVGGLGSFAMRPAPGINGRQYLTTDGSVLWVEDGATWFPVIDGCVGVQVPPVASFPTSFGVGATFADFNGAIIATTTAAGSNSVAGVTAALPGAAFTVTAHVKMWNKTAGNSFGCVGLCLFDGTKITMLALNNQVNATDVCKLSVVDWSNTTTTSGAPYDGETSPANGIWLKINDDGAVNQTFSVSVDGKNWLDVLVRARGAFLNATSVGLMVNRGNQVIGLVDSYSAVSP